ncbi:hypothetical protein EYZ01_01330 [Hafnia alvei]|nr:hypothetical protein EYZ01_01330 [Hafnia alvei]
MPDYGVCACGVRFRPPISTGIHIQLQSKAFESGAPARAPNTRALLSETPSPLRFGIAHPGRPKLRHDIPVVPALPTKTYTNKKIRRQTKYFLSFPC